MEARTSLLKLLIGLTLVIGLLGLTTGVAGAADPMFFSLDSEGTSPQYQMERQGGPGDDGQSGEILATSGGHVYWIADEAAQVDYHWPVGCWTLQMVTDSDWGTNGSAAQMQLGSWNPGSATFTEFTTYSVVSVSYDAGSNTVILQVECQSGDEVTPSGEHFALKVTNNDSIDHTVCTDGCSWLEAPCNGPVYPVPGLPSVILVMLGTVLLGGVIYARNRRNPSLTLSRG